LFIVNLETHSLEFIHESFALWENSISSFINDTTEELISLTH